MDIDLSPVVGMERVAVIKSRETLKIGGELFDFSPLSEGDVLPLEAIESRYIKWAMKENGVIKIALRFGIGSSAPMESRFPDLLTNVPDGDVSLPLYDKEGGDAD